LVKKLFICRKSKNAGDGSEIITTSDNMCMEAAMRVLKLIPLFFLFLMLGSQFVFPFSQVYAWTCCTRCNQKFCNPPGSGSCPWFACPNHSINSQIQTLSSNKILAIVGSSDPQLSPAFGQSSIGRLITLLSSSQCTRDNFTLRFFQNEGDLLKFASDFPKYNTSRNNTLVTFQMGTNGEK
jgi:hypothetical protein